MPEPSSPTPKKLLDQLGEAIRIKHYSYSTEKTYVHWAKRSILFHNKRHPAEMGAPEIEAFLTSSNAKSLFAKARARNIA